MGRTLIGISELEIDGVEYIVGELQVKTIQQLLADGKKETAIRLAVRKNINLPEGSSVCPPGNSGDGVAKQRRAAERKVARPESASEFGPNIPASKEGQEAQALAQATLDEANADEASVKAKTEPIVQEPKGFESAPADD